MNFICCEFVKVNVVVIVVVVVGLLILVCVSNLVIEVDVISLVWNKVFCCFCGIGCSVMVVICDGQVVVIYGDIKVEVNCGINCVKGYFLLKIMYGSDCLICLLLCMKDGKFDKQGEFQLISWEQVFDIMVEKFKVVFKVKGLELVGMFGFGQWMVWEGYVVNKLFKVGLCSNNIDFNVCYCMVLVVMGFMCSFGMDELMGCYDDIEVIDSFVFWGLNMVEMYLVFWLWVIDCWFSVLQVKVVVLFIFEYCSFELVDLFMVFKLQIDLIIFNYIVNYIIESGVVNCDFVECYVCFVYGVEDIGYGLCLDDLLEKKVKNVDKVNIWSDIDFKVFVEFVKFYILECIVCESGVLVEWLKVFVEFYVDFKCKVVLFWIMGFNQYICGVWVNNLIYNIYLFIGKISELGNSFFLFIGQFLVCGIVCEVGIFFYWFFVDLVVINLKYWEIVEKIWKVLVGIIQEKVGFYVVQQSWMFKDGVFNVYWIQVSNNMQVGFNVMQEVLFGWCNLDNFVIVFDVYFIVLVQVVDLILFSVMWVEKEGVFGNVECCMQFWYQLVKVLGEVKFDFW